MNTEIKCFTCNYRSIRTMPMVPYGYIECMIHPAMTYVICIRVHKMYNFHFSQTEASAPLLVNRNDLMTISTECCLLIIDSFSVRTKEESEKKLFQEKAKKYYLTSCFHGTHQLLLLNNKRIESSSSQTKFVQKK